MDSCWIFGVTLLKFALELRLYFFVIPDDLILQIHLLLIVLRRLDVLNYLFSRSPS
jgi:hypothetical protein